MNDKNITALCLLETSKNPVKILLNLAKSLDCPVHNPVHHILVGSALLTAYKNSGGDIDLEKALEELKKRAQLVPGRSLRVLGSLRCRYFKRNVCVDSYGLKSPCQ